MGKQLVLFTGGLAATAGIVGLILVLAFVTSLWSVWWLYPLWDLVIVPLGFPSLSFYAFWAVCCTWAYVFHPAQPPQYKSEDDKTQWGSWWSVRLLTPVFGYYFVHWLMS